MVKAAGNPVSRTRRNTALAILAATVITHVNSAFAQVAPIDHSGYLEYQFRTSRNENGVGSDQHLATWRANASTFVWRPYILMLDGNIGLSRSRSVDSRNTVRNTIVTGGIVASAFARSPFPLRLYFQSSDSRVDGDVFDSDLATRNWGFLQRLASRRDGSSLSLEYRASDTDNITVNGRTDVRKFGSELWQLTGNKVLGRNEFRLLTSATELTRRVPSQSQDRVLLSLRHRFRSGARFTVDDTLFYNGERLNLNGMEQFRRFLQFNGYSNWQPSTSKPLTVIGRLVGRGVETGNGTSRGSHSFLVSGTATYQYSRQMTFSTSAGFDGGNGDNAESRNGSFQRFRGSYRGIPIGLGRLSYGWGASVNLGNRRDSNGTVESLQAFGASFNHGLSRAAILGGGRQLQFGLTQTVSAAADTLVRRRQSLVHTAYASLSRQRGRTSSYLRFSASDRRLYGDRRDEFHLFSLQGSSRMQMNRTRSLNGSFSLQYSNSESPMTMNGDSAGPTMRETGTFTYSINLSYVDRKLFDVRDLYFVSQLRYISSEFRNDDEFDGMNEFNRGRSDSSWQNELTYRIGLLELRLLAAVRDIDDRWNGQAFFSIRRYYGTT